MEVEAGGRRKKMLEWESSVSDPRGSLCRIREVPGRHSAARRLGLSYAIGHLARVDELRCQMGPELRRPSGRSEIGRAHV